jgi:mannose-6-phosphate isomerase-like protein (cupin superfamily)
MPRIVNISETAWSAAVTPDSREIWQVQAGAVIMSFGATAPTDPGDGIILRREDVIEIEQGEVVRYRRYTNSPAVLVRKARVTS